MITYIIGFISGIVSGMGIGGGTILIPMFVILTNIQQQSIQSINLIYFIPTAIIAIIIHFKNKLIDYKISIKIIIFGLIGSAIGSLLAINFDPQFLRKIFGVFLFIMGSYEIVCAFILPIAKKYFIDIH